MGVAASRPRALAFMAHQSNGTRSGLSGGNAAISAVNQVFAAGRNRHAVGGSHRRRPRPSRTPIAAPSRSWCRPVREPWPGRHRVTAFPLCLMYRQRAGPLPGTMGLACAERIALALMQVLHPWSAHGCRPAHRRAGPPGQAPGRAKLVMRELVTRPVRGWCRQR